MVFHVFLKILIGSVFPVASVIRISACLPALFVADFAGKVKVECGEISLVYIIVEGSDRAGDRILIGSIDMG